MGNDGTDLGSERTELLADLEGLKERLAKLKTQEQAVVDEEEALHAIMGKMSTALAEPRLAADDQISRLWESIRALRPFRTPLLLSISLGRGARFVLPFKQRLRYKHEYEQFKLWTVGVHFCLCLVQLVVDSVLLDTIGNFHLLYYYSVLTLREHILVANGSNIRPWWIAHHYLCVVIAAVLLVWPVGPEYLAVRRGLLYFSLYVSGLQALQYRYQMRRLYTLRALARVGPMQTTTESASVHVRNDLAFLLPLLLLSHLWQFYLAWLLRRVSLASPLWQVPVLSALFLAIGIGNLSTALVTLVQKAL